MNDVVRGTPPEPGWSGDPGRLRQGRGFDRPVVVVPLLVALSVVLMISMAAALRDASGFRVVAVSAASLLMIAVLSTGLIRARRIQARADALWYLEQNRSRMRDLADSSPNLVFQLSSDGIVIFASRAAQNLLGRTAEELVGTDLIERLVSQSAPDTRTRLQRLVEHGRPQFFTVHATGAEGVTRLLECGLRLGSTENVTEVWGSLRDVTARTSAGDQVEQLFQLSADFMAVIDDKGRLVQINPVWSTAFDVDSQDLIGTDFAARFHAGDRQSAQRLTPSLEADPVTGFENRYERDGVTRTVHWSAATDPVRRLTYLVGRDVTEQKELARTLAETRDEALEASRVKSEFVATMSHEIRTPMNGVIGLTDLLLNTPLDASQRRYVEGIRTAGDTLLSVIDDILDFSKIEAGRLLLESLDFRLEDVIDDVAAVVRQTASEKGIHLVVDYQPGVPVALNGDPGRLRQIMVHLVDNAVKFTEQGEVSIRVEPGAANPDGQSTVIFKVIDTGIGMDEARLEELFEPFRQVEGAAGRVGGGSGLGLSICRRLAALMGGRITAHSELGQGATFVAELTFGAATDWGRAIRGRDARGLAVLVVDPDEASRLRMAKQLSRWGMRPVAAESADEAMTLLTQEETPAGGYDVAVIDVAVMDMAAIDVLPGDDVLAGDEVPAGDDVLTGDGRAGDGGLAGDGRAGDGGLGGSGGRAGDGGINLVEQLSTVANLPVILLGADGTTVSATGSGPGVRARLAKPVQQSALFDALTRVGVPSTAAAGSAGSGHAPVQVTTAVFGSGRPSSRDGGFHLLLVEDNDINQTVALGILSQLGYRVDVAGDGLEALAMTERRNYDAILMDCQMPKMDGYTATVELRKRQDTRSTPIIAMTAATFAADRQRCFDSGMDDFIAKPVRVASLQATLDRWLPVGQAADPSARPTAARHGVDSWSDVEFSTDSQTDTDSQTITKSQTDTDSQTDTGSSADPSAESSTDPGAGPGADPGSRSGAEQGAGSGAEQGSGSGAAVGSEAVGSGAVGSATVEAVADSAAGPKSSSGAIPSPRAEAATGGPGAVAATGLNAGSGLIPAARPVSGAGLLAGTGERIAELLGQGSAAEVQTVREMIASFLGRSVDLHQRLTLAVAADDAEAAYQHAHSLSEVGTNLGATEVVQISRQIEADAEAGRPGLSVARLVLLDVALDRARVQLGDLAAALPNAEPAQDQAPGVRYS